MNVNVDVPILSSEFDKSLQYLMDMQEKENKKEKEKEKEKENEKEKEEMIKSENPLRVLEKVDNPSYGCMKVGGTLPTYRQYHRHTQKNVANLGDLLHFPDNGRQSINDTQSIPVSQKKTLKRTFTIGKSNKDKTISVLVSNKTKRHQVSNQDFELKSTPMIDVRRYLVKHGLIKIGTISPPEVLRKMYESASLICRDVTNHNSDTLMYNYLNSESDSEKTIS